MRFKTLSSALMLSGLLATSACTDAGETLQILQNQAVGTGECTVSATQGNSLATGSLDVTAAADTEIGYILTPLVTSRAQNQQSGQQGTNITFITGANVDLSAADGSALQAEQTSYFIPLSGSINPGSNTGLAFEVMTAATASAIFGGGASLVNANVTILGETDGGGTESQTFTYPIRLCDGCTRVSVGSCSELVAGFTPTQSVNACNPAQDSLVQCCDNSTGGLTCPAAAETP